MGDGTAQRGTDADSAVAVRTAESEPAIQRSLAGHLDSTAGSWGARTRWRPSRWPGVCQAFALYVISRLFDFLIIGRVARFQAPSAWSSADPGYSGILSLWDGDWYRRIAETGYPDSLPIGPDGLVQQNEWAFYPLFPMTVRAVQRVLGTGWAATASTVALICGALATLVLYDLVKRTSGSGLALWTVALFAFFPSAPVLQLAYTESIGILLLVLTLWSLQRRAYLWGTYMVLLVGLARPIGAPLAAVVGLHLLIRIRRHRQELMTVRQILGMAAMTGAAAVSAFEWPFLAGRATGVPDAYFQSMAAWRGGHQIVWFKPWWWMSRYFLGDWIGPAALALVTVLTVWVLTRPAARVIAGDLRNWVICYLLYLAAALDPSTSLPRYLLLLFPLGTVAAAASPSRAYRNAVTVAFAAAQILWVAWLWRFSPPTDWPP